MITKEQLLAAIIREIDIYKHLYTKLGAHSHGYRPSPAQRSTVDLLRYLAICGIGGLQSLAGGDFKIFSEYSARVKEMPAEDFPMAMDRQKTEIEGFFDSLSEETLQSQEATMPGGWKLPLGAAIMNGPLKWLTAYKMQLFLYAKANGADVVTSNVWAGMDRRV